jgi:hypothetical protein
MKKHVLNEYHGKYEFVLSEELDSDKFKDTSKYKFVFDLDKITYSRTYFERVPQTNVVQSKSRDYTTASYYILDRQKDIRYYSPITSSFFAKLIQSYMINLEKERLKKASTF